MSLLGHVSVLGLKQLLVLGFTVPSAASSLGLVGPRRRDSFAECRALPNLSRSVPSAEAAATVDDVVVMLRLHDWTHPSISPCP